MWVLALLLALVVAGVFAWLGQWQLSHSIEEDTTEQIDTETPRPLAELNAPGEPVTDASAGRVVTIDGEFAPSDFTTVESRVNDGDEGAWVIGHLVSEHDGEPAHLAVAVGWAPSVAEAERVADDLASSRGIDGPQQLAGRYMPAEGVETPGPKDDPFAIRTMAPAQLANIWEGIENPVYAGFLVLHDEGSSVSAVEAGLDRIDSVPPLPQDRINWLNLFYAVEWVVFAGFAVYFWFRLARDAWEKEHERRRLDQAEHDPASDGPEASSADDSSTPAHP